MKRPSEQLVLTLPGRPGLSDLELGLRTGGKGSLIFNNYLLRQDIYLPQTFLK